VGQKLTTPRGWENDTLSTGPEHCVLETIRYMLSVSPEIKTDIPA
jgi:hypothetical protein